MNVWPYAFLTSTQDKTGSRLQYPVAWVQGKETAVQTRLEVTWSQAPVRTRSQRGDPLHLPAIENWSPLPKPVVPEISIPAHLSQHFNRPDENSAFKWFHWITFQKIPHLFFSSQFKICKLLLLLLLLLFLLHISYNNLQKQFLYFSLSLSLSLGLYFSSHAGKISL